MEGHGELLRDLKKSKDDVIYYVNHSQPWHAVAVFHPRKGGKISRMWLRPDTENLGADPKAGEEEPVGGAVGMSCTMRIMVELGFFSRHILVF